MIFCAKKIMDCYLRARLLPPIEACALQPLLYLREGYLKDVALEDKHP